MKQNELAEFSQALSHLSALYGQAMSPASVELYWAALQAFDLVRIKQALSHHALHPDRGRFMPRPADVVRAVQGDSQTQSLRAWSKVAYAIRSVGGYTSVVFDDPLIHAVIEDMGGWITLCSVKQQELPFREKDFVARYAGYVGYPPPPYPSQLTGRLAHQNQLQGFKLEAPVCVGDQQKALRVYQQGQSFIRLLSALPLAITEQRESL
jgi:hypothetical protein